jgi:hypothetical protein
MISPFYQPAPNSDARPSVITPRRESAIFPGWGPKV